MKTIKTSTVLKTAFCGALLLALAFAGCSDDFLQEKKLYTAGGWEIFDSEGLAQQKVNWIYNSALPDANSGEGPNIQAGGASDAQSQTTEEYGGSPAWANTAIPLTYQNVPGFFYTSINDSPWSRIRDCNITLQGLAMSSLPETSLVTMKGETYFWRGYLYFRLFQWYGGVPIITETQEPILGTGTGEHLKVNRGTMKETFEQIVSDLDQAIAMLPDVWPANQYGRITKTAAMALKARVLLFYASPLYNRADDPARWEAAYTAALAAYNNAVGPGGRELVMNQSQFKAKEWGDMFARWDTKEGVMVTLYNTTTDDQLRKENGWENSLRPKTEQHSAQGGGRVAPSVMVDLFPMADGKRPGESSIAYDPVKFFVDRDPRFYRTFAFPGSVWAYSGASGYTYWNYNWYDKPEDLADPRKVGYHGSYNTTAFNSSVHIRKRSSSTATFNGANTNNFIKTASPFLSIRMGEVVLNLAEAAAGAGKLPEGYNYLKMIRERVYGSDSPYAADDFGLKGAEANRQSLLRAILYERQIELAYEGFRFHDMRRWLLWEGGEENDAFKPAWSKGNTLTYLGLEPYNGARRYGLQIHYPEALPGKGASVLNNDPLAAERPAGLDPDAEPDDWAIQMAALSEFYDNLARKEVDLLDNNDDRTIQYRSQYYFPGLPSNVMNNMPYLWQNTGWQDYYNQPGKFDVLSETLPSKPQNEKE